MGDGLSLSRLSRRVWSLQVRVNAHVRHILTCVDCKFIEICPGRQSTLKNCAAEFKARPAVILKQELN